MEHSNKAKGMSVWPVKSEARQSRMPWLSRLHASWERLPNCYIVGALQLISGQRHLVQCIMSIYQDAL